MPLLQNKREIAFEIIAVSLAFPLLFSCVERAPESNGSAPMPSMEQTSFPKGEDNFKIVESDYFSREETPEAPGEASQIKFGDAVEGMKPYPTLRLFAGGEQIPVYTVKVNSSRTWSKDAKGRSEDAVASFSLKGKATLKLQCAFNPKEDVTIRPLGRNVPWSVDSSRWVISFTISTPGQYLIETRSRTLHLFVNPFKDIPAGATVFSPGLHSKENDPRINSNDEIVLRNGDKIYLEEGAILRAKIRANGAYNVSVEGPGFLDGSSFIRDVDKGIANVPIDFQFCRNVKLEDFALLDPAGWAFNLYCSEKMSLKNVKVISSRSNGDGVSVQSCKDVDVSYSFVRSWDDSLVVKNYVDYKTGKEGETSSIHFSDCLLYTDLAQSMEIGYETIGEKMKDISFENITVLHAFHKPVFSIHNGNNADIRNVVYRDITVEEASLGQGDGDNTLFDFDVSHSPIWSDAHKITPLGSISGVTCSNIKVLSGKENPRIKISGSIEKRPQYPNEEHRVTGVRFENVEICGEKLSASYPNMAISHADAPTFLEGEATGASYPSSDVSSFGSKLIRVK